MSSQIAEWEAVLVNLGEQFAWGGAAVKPKTAEACRNCALPALCRISEVRASSEQIEAEDE
jgi:hypothetical protein